jgi:hypothetical protein
LDGIYHAPFVLRNRGESRRGFGALRFLGGASPSRQSSLGRTEEQNENEQRGEPSQQIFFLCSADENGPAFLKTCIVCERPMNLT